MRSSAKKPVLKQIKKEASAVHGKIVRKQKPSLKFPVRSLANVKYRPKLGYFQMTGKTKERTLTVNTVKTFAQTLRMMALSKELVEADGPESIHVVRAVSNVPAIDIQLRGPELGRPGRLLRPREPVDISRLQVGARIAAIEEIDGRPGQSGDGAAAGRPVAESA